MEYEIKKFHSAMDRVNKKIFEIYLNKQSTILKHSKPV